jgi:hypothetical protein
MGRTPDTPPPKTGDVKHDSNKDNRRVDRESKDSFPASDPPSHNSGSIGAPRKRETPPPDKKEFDKAKRK